VSDTIFVDNSKSFLEAFDKAIVKALERCGMQAEGYAKDRVPVDTGNLRNSISFRVDASNKEVFIGTNNEYAAYVELGTGKYKEGGGGRPDPWVYQDDNGNWHHTHGQKAQPYLKPAVANHKQTYKNIIEDSLKNA
jgi:HK97 gp10 family phage protein